MKDYNKNVLIMILLTVIVISVCEKYQLGLLTWIIEIMVICIWLVISPFKFTEDV